MKTVVKTIIVLFASLLAGSTISYAQDLMYLKNVKEPVKVKVVEIGLDEVKYRPWGDTIIPVLVIPRLNVSKLVLANGAVFEFKDNPMTNPYNYTDQHNNAIKFSFLSPLFTNLSFSYERSLKPGRSYELGLGIIGIGVQYDDGYEPSKPGGVVLRGGVKFMSSPDFYLRGMRYAHILKGAYIKPELVIANYGVNRYSYSYNYNYSSYYPYYHISQVNRRNVIAGAILINFGKQWVMDDRFLIDMFFGVGYGVSNYSKVDIPNGYRDNYGPEVFHYGFLGGANVFPIALSGGIKLGYLFGKQKIKPTTTP